MSDGFEELDESLKHQINCLILAVLMERQKDKAAEDKALMLSSNTKGNAALIDEHSFAQNILALISKNHKKIIQLKAEDKLFDYNAWFESKTN